MKIRERAPNFSEASFSFLFCSKVCSFNILLVTTRILLLLEGCHVRLYWAVFSALYLQLPQCVTCRGEGSAELLRGERWVPVPGHTQHSQEVGCSHAQAAWAAWLSSTGWRNHLRVLVCRRAWLPSARHKTWSNLCFQKWRRACSPHALSVFTGAAESLHLTKF